MPSVTKKMVIWKGETSKPRKSRMGVVDSLDISPEAKKDIGNMLKDGSISKEEQSAFNNNKSLSPKDKALLSKHINKWKKK